VLAPLVGPEGKVLFSTDMAVAGVHGDLSLMGLDDLGWRAVAGALSDIAAMGGRADHAVVAVAGPPDTDLDLLYEGVAGAADAHGCPVVGGDLSNADQVVVAVAVTGHVAGGPGPVLRSGARPGDHVVVTGPLGSSAAALRALRAQRAAGNRPRPGVPETGTEGDLAHRRPRARLAEGEAARLAGASAMIDVSDGLAADLWHLADASEIGFRLDDVPVGPKATLDEALGGGEDYELVFTAPDAAPVLEAFGRGGLRPPIVMGVCVPDPGRRTFAGRPLVPRGWEHAWGGA